MNPYHPFPLFHHESYALQAIPKLGLEYGSLSVREDVEDGGDRAEPSKLRQLKVERRGLGLLPGGC